jgi:hypothetical protein
MSDRAAPVRLAASLDGAPGAPVLVLGNSLGTTSELWQPQAAAHLRPAQMWNSRAALVRSEGMGAVARQAAGAGRGCDRCG